MFNRIQLVFICKAMLKIVATAKEVGVPQSSKHCIFSSLLNLANKIKIKLLVNIIAWLVYLATHNLAFKLDYHSSLFALYTVWYDRWYAHN